MNNVIKEEKSVLIVEDHPLVADATRDLLSKMNVTLEITICNCARTAIEKVIQFPSWFRIFLDLDIPGAYGLSLVRQFAQLGVANRCAVITAFDNPQWAMEVKELGMLGYIVKAAPMDAFTSALESVLYGQSAFFKMSMNCQPPTRLTRRQQDVLSLLHRGYSSKEIARQLALTEGTVDNHVTGLLRALGVSNRTHAIAKAMELGYIKIQHVAQPVASSI